MKIDHENKAGNQNMNKIRTGELNSLQNNFLGTDICQRKDDYQIPQYRKNGK